MSFNLRYMTDGFNFHRSKDFEAMKAGKLAIWPWLSCQYNKNTLVDLPSSVHFILKIMDFVNECCLYEIMCGRVGRLPLCKDEF